MPGGSPGLDSEGIEIAVVGANIDEPGRHHWSCQYLPARCETPQQMPVLPIQADQRSTIIPHVQFAVGQRHTAAYAIDERLFRFAIKRIEPEQTAMHAIQREDLAVPRSEIERSRTHQGRAGDTISCVK